MRRGTKRRDERILDDDGELDLPGNSQSDGTSEVQRDPDGENAARQAGRGRYGRSEGAHWFMT